MNTLNQTLAFKKWLKKLKDIQAKLRIIKRIQQAEDGNFGDCKQLDGGLYEMRIHIGSGYRVYYMRQGDIVYLLVLGGDKSTQQKDIEKARTMQQAILKGEDYE